MGGYIDVWMGLLADRWIYRWMDGIFFGCIDEFIYGRLGEPIDGWMDLLMDGWIY